VEEYIKIKNLSLCIPPNDIFRNINLEVPKGSFSAILGLSGAGKTQFLRTLANLNNEFTPTPFIDNSISYAFQKSLLIPWLSLQSNLDICSVESSANWLKKVGLEQFKDYYPNQVSGGMQQKVNLVRAFSMMSDIILLDEPFSSLDHSNKQMLYSELLQFWKEQKNTIFFVSHDIIETLFLAQKIFLFSKVEKTIVDCIENDLPYPRLYKDIINSESTQSKFEKIQRFLINDFDQKVI
jgi:ABC-type nitrate/sulfonate/bicarbonate transport system ATPase subunit